MNSSRSSWGVITVYSRVWASPHVTRGVETCFAGSSTSGSSSILGGSSISSSLASLGRRTGVAPLLEGGVGSTSLSLGTNQGKDNLEGSILSSVSAGEKTGSRSPFGAVTTLELRSKSTSASALALVIFTLSLDRSSSSGGTKKAP